MNSGETQTSRSQHLGTDSLVSAVLVPPLPSCVTSPSRSKVETDVEKEEYKRLAYCGVTPTREKGRNRIGPRELSGCDAD